MKDDKVYKYFTCRLNTYRIHTLQSQRRSAPLCQLPQLPNRALI